MERSHTAKLTLSKRLAVMPLDALAQMKGQSGTVLAPEPLGSEIRDDRLKTVLFHTLVEDHKIVEHSHHRPYGIGGGFLQDGHTGGAVRRVDLQNAPDLLRHHGATGGYADQK